MTDLQHAVRGSDVAGEVVSDPWERLPWRTVLRVSLARGVLVVVASLMVCALLPLAAGWTPRVILSGSMEPRIPAGDVVVTRAVSPEELRAGHVVTVRDPDHEGRTRTHRVVRRDGAEVVTRGDANGQADSTPVGVGDVLGVGVLRVPYVGLPAHWASERSLAFLSASALALALLVLGAGLPGPSARGPRGGGGGGSGSHRAALRPAPRPPRVLAPLHRRRGVVATVAPWVVVGALVGVAGSVTATGSYAAFASSTSSSASARAAAVFNPYADAVKAKRPVFYWRLDEQSGDTVSDASGRGATGFTYNAVWGRTGAIPTGVPNRAVELRGSAIEQSARYTIGREWTVELWVRTTTTLGGPLAEFLNGDTGGHDRVLYLGRDGKVRFGTGGATAHVTGTSAVNDGLWHHVVLSNVGSGTGANDRSHLYVDGAEEAVGATVKTVVQGNWRLGRAAWKNNVDGQPDEYYRGDLDDVAVYDAKLDATAVKDHYDLSGVRTASSRN